MGSRGRIPRKFRGFTTIKLLSDEHAFIPLIVTLAGHELGLGPPLSSQKLRGFIRQIIVR